MSSNTALFGSRIVVAHDFVIARELRAARRFVQLAQQACCSSDLLVRKLVPLGGHRPRHERQYVATGPVLTEVARRPREAAPLQKPEQPRDELRGSLRWTPHRLPNAHHAQTQVATRQRYSGGSTPRER